ncbi:VCBS repeat-containing protein [Chryseobacterium sp.]|uniref:VCBS repeat-containing protein n=1 Tax=Chryseobacterium sp. TaxID=1871047 RepID=UPI002FC9D715
MKTKFTILFFLFSLILISAQTEICGNGLDDDGDGYVDSYDSDCFTGPAPTCFTPATSTSFGIQLNVQGAANALDVSMSPTLGDIDNDGKVEIIAPLNNSVLGFIVYEVNGTTLTQESYTYNISMNAPVNGTVSQPAIADIDKNGTSEVVCVGANGFIYVFNYTGGTATTFKWRSDLATDTPFGSPRISDIDQDGVPEIIVGNDIFRFSAGLGALNRVVLGSNTNPYGLDNIPGWGSGDVTVVDILSSNPGKEIVAGSVVYGVNFTTNTLTILKNLSTIAGAAVVPNNSDGPTAVADLDGDGDLDVVYTSRTTGRVYVWDPQNDLLLMNVAGGGTGRAGEPTIAYVYDETTKGLGYTTDLPEIIIVNTSIVVAYNLQFPGNKRVWSFATTDTSGETGITAFDFNGDSIMEMIYNDETRIRIMNGNVNPPVNLSTFNSGTATWMEHPVVADVDGDNQAEMIAFSGDVNTALNGRLNIFNPTPGNVWQPARKVWNQRGYHIVNINDDLTVPTVESSSVKFMPAASPKFKTLNQYNVQFNPNNLRLEPGTVAATDARLTTLIFVNGATNTLQAEISVLGDSDLPAGTPITIYRGNPTTSSASVVAQTVYTTATISVGTTTIVNIPGVFILGYDYYAIINDNGSKPRPFNLSTDFPSTGTTECNYTNNMKRITPAEIDTDGDGSDDDADLDIDNDGILNIVENQGYAAFGDEDNDGIPNCQDVVDNGTGDGSSTVYTDADGNGVPDVYDVDGDGILNINDLDSDNDGILDIHESGQTTGVDANGDGILDGAVGTDGVPDSVQPTPNGGTVNYTMLNTDGIGQPNYLDWDSDEDGCFDAIEGDETVYLSQINANGSINTTANGGIDENGVPQLVNTGGTADIGGDYGQGVGGSANVAIYACICYNNPNTSGPGIDTNFGITLLQRAGSANVNWPMVRKSAHIALESNTKGFVITRMTTTALTSITNPVEGMLVYDITEKCLKIYDGVSWKCFNIPSCQN